MLEPLVGRNHYSGSFFRLLQVAPRYSFSLGLNLIRWFSIFASFDLVRGLDAPNPFTFIQNCTLYSLRTIPHTSASDNYLGWAAYQSIVDEVTKGTLGPITQNPGSYYFPVDSWSAKACDLDIVLETNSTDPEDLFMFDFKNMVANDTEFTAAASMTADQCQHLSQSDIILYTSLCVLGLVIVLFIFKATCDEIFKCNRRNGYDSLNDRPRDYYARRYLAPLEDEEAPRAEQEERPRSHSQ